MSALGNGSRFSDFKSDSVLPSSLPSATTGGSTQVNMQSKLVGGKKRKSAKKTKKTAKRKSAKRKSSKKSISGKIKSMGKKLMFWK
jgi:hypothetical protein